MIQVIKADERHFSDYGWLQTYWLFSFGDYYDPTNVHLGALRVFNDDVIVPGRGFPTHPHREMEIVTIPLSGELTHKDSSGAEGVIRTGDVQRMSAGTGIRHSEYNNGNTPCHLYQIWIYPDVQGLEPGYEQRSHDPSMWQRRLFPIASGQKHIRDVVRLHSDSTIYRSELKTGQTKDYAMESSRCVFIYITFGALLVNKERLDGNDQARITGETDLRIEALKDASFVLIDVPEKLGE